MQNVCLGCSIDFVMIGPLHKAYPDGCQHRLHNLLRLRPYPMRGHWLLHSGMLNAAQQQRHAFSAVALQASDYRAFPQGKKALLTEVIA